MDPKDFDFLKGDPQQEGESAIGFPPAGTAVNEYGEVIDDEDINDQPEVFFNTDDNNEETSVEDGHNLNYSEPVLNTPSTELNTPNTKETELAVVQTPATNTSPSPTPLWHKRSLLAPNETDREFLLFNYYISNPGGRSATCISRLSNLGIHTIQKISAKNNWKQRAEDYDRHIMVQKLKQAETQRHQLHLQKLEKYRQDQEALGQQMTLNAARIAFLSNVTLEKMLTEEKDLDIRDLPTMLNTAAKLAEVGKTLQSSALGVDNLLAAIEEADQG